MSIQQHSTAASIARRASSFGLCCAIGYGAISLMCDASAYAGQPCTPHWIQTPGQPGMDDQIRALIVFDDNTGNGPALYAGGFFDNAGNVLSPGVARWNAQSQQWEFAGVVDGFFSVNDFEVLSEPAGDVLYVSAFDLMRYENGQWVEVSGSPSSVHSGIGAYYGGAAPELFVSGGFIFNTPEGMTEYIVRYIPSQAPPWHAAGDGLISVALDYATFNDGTGDKFYAAGSFGFFGTPNAFGIAHWDGAKWSGVGGSTNGSGHALEIYDDGNGPALYIGGGFSRAGFNTPARSIAKWNGTQWSALGDGINGNVRAMAVFDDGSGAGAALFVGGEFSMAGTTAVNNIAKWNGATWSAVGGGVNDAVHAMHTFQHNGRTLLAVAGEFTMAGGNPANRIAFFGCDDPILGDLDNNGVVDVADLFQLLAGWGDCSQPCPPSCPPDLNDDCSVNVSDLFTLLSNWG